MKFSAVLGFVAGLAGLAAAAPTKSHHNKGNGSASVVTVEAATIFVQENTDNYYITFEAVELIEREQHCPGTPRHVISNLSCAVVEVDVHGSGNGRGHHGRWDTSASRYGDHVTVTEEIILVEVVTQRRYRTTTTIEVAEYITVTDRSVEARGHGKNHGHSNTEVITITVAEVFVYEGRHYRAVEAVEVEVIVKSSSSKREALALPGHGNHKNSNRCEQTTITVAAAAEVIVGNTHYETVTAVEVVVEIVENGCSTH